jgi:hypothetical protein
MRSVCIPVLFLSIRNHHQNRGFAVQEMDRLDPSVFKNMFRLDRSSFDEQLEIITPYLIHSNEAKAKISSGSCITPKTRLAVTLRWLARASNLDLCFAWGVAHSTFF